MGKVHFQKDKISIGCHELDDYGVGKTHSNRYVNLKTGKYDGVHYLGPKGSLDYTRSFTDIILKTVGLKTSAGLQNNQNYQHCEVHSTITTQNRFSIFTEGNFQEGRGAPLM